MAKICLWKFVSKEGKITTFPIEQTKYVESLQIEILPNEQIVFFMRGVD